MGRINYLAYTHTTRLALGTLTVNTCYLHYTRMKAGRGRTTTFDEITTRIHV